ncbi:MAG TPA: response regulator [Desulfobacteria bacterium]|nr:response regulator [Desulfobacteria bacterium]
MYDLRVIVVDTDPIFRKYIKEKLMNAGHSVVGESSNGRHALQLIFTIQPDLVIMSARLPGKDGLEVAKAIEEHRVAPVILVTEPEKQDEITEALEDWMISYILKPVDETNLLPAIEVCRSIYRKMSRLEEENRKLKQTLETRKMVEKAKSLLMRCKGMSEQEAFKHIQRISMDKSVPIKKVAKQIITSLDQKKLDTAL